MKVLSMVLITVLFILCLATNAQPVYCAEIKLNLLKTVDISPKLSQIGEGVRRPDVIAIGDILYLAYGDIRKRNFQLIQLKANIDLTPVKEIPRELFSGNYDLATDIRVAKSDDYFWYAFEDIKKGDRRLDIKKRVLNAAWYTKDTLDLIKTKTEIARGVNVALRQAFAFDPALVPVKPEAVDDPTPFNFNGVYYIFTRAWSGLIKEFTPNTVHHIRVFDKELKQTDDFTLDISSAMPQKTLSQNTLIAIKNQVYLIGGFYYHRKAKSSDIYAIPLSKDLRSVVGNKIPLLIDPNKFFYKVTAAKFYEGYLYLNYAENYQTPHRPPQGSSQHIAVFDVRNNFKFLTSVEVSRYPARTVAANHMTFEIINDRLYVFYPEVNDRIFVKIYEITTN